ncbi:MAG: asparagine synthase (glutamine-hydrolyzing) [Elusimicrobiota bacterium]
MCGILGIFDRCGRDLPAGPTTQALLRAGRVIAHRGPDAEGAVVLGPAGFGHRRLAILDLNARSNQPMSSPDGSVLLTYNGEIYNFAELRAELQKAGRSFTTSSDTEVLISGYQHWGLEGVLSRAAGMFAFALYDASCGKLFLARDRAGKKPLYHAESGGRSVFCSELRGLLALRPGAPALSPEGLESYLQLKFVPSPGTLLQGVRKVPPGCYLEVSRQGSTLKRYWSPLSARASTASYAEACDRVDAALSKAARRRLVSDVPVCVFLSGGVDSSLIVDKLHEAGQDGTASYTIGYRDLPGYNEFEYSRMVARKYPLDYREVVLGSSEVLGALQEDLLDDPVSDWVWVPLHFLSKRARADGFKVVLLGEGSDEVFFGYDVMLKGLDAMRRYGRPAWKGLAKAAYHLGRPVYDVSRRGHVRYDLLRRAAQGLPLYGGSSIGFPWTQRHQVAGPALGPGDDDHAGDFLAGLHARFDAEASDPSDDVNRISFIEFHTKMAETLLHRVDRVSMLHSLEARAPFLDHELVELAFSLPGRLKIPERRLKGLLKDVALRRLPPGVVQRRKMGFSFPFKEWLRGPLGPAVEHAFETSRLFQDHWVSRAFCRTLLREHRSGLVDHAPRLWTLYSLCRWYDRWAA